MKKLAIFFLLVIIIITSMWAMYFNYKVKVKQTNKKNYSYSSYLDKEISGSELTSIINRAIDNNTLNEVTKDKKGKYINNHENSISIKIKMLDDGKIYDMEKIYNGGMNNFVIYYGEIKFKCTKIEYHQLTKLVKSMLFEQITQ